MIAQSEPARGWTVAPGLLGLAGRMVSFREDAIEDERAASPSVDGQFDGRDPAGDAGGHRRPIDCRAVRADPGRPPARAAARPAAGAGQRNRAQPPSRRHAAPQPDRGGILSISSAPAAGRITFQPLSTRSSAGQSSSPPSGARPSPTMVATRRGSSSTPARRAPRHGGGPAAGLFLGLCRRPRHPHGLAAHRPARGAAAAASAIPSDCRSSATIASRARCRAISKWCWSSSDPASGLHGSCRSRAQDFAAHRRRLFREPVLSRHDRDQGRRDRRARPAHGRAAHRRRRSAVPRHPQAAGANMAPTSRSARPSRSACT